MTTLIKNATVVTDGVIENIDVLINEDVICYIGKEATDQQPKATHDINVVDATGCFLLPGVIDDHVHFRQPGLTQKADIATESRAAAAGGVTTYFDMPNTVPQTTSVDALMQKFDIARRESVVNYSFFFGATNDNIAQFSSLDPHIVPGIKLFMGSSTGNMLVDKKQTLDQIFATANMPIMTHCEDTAIINANMAEAKRLYGNDPDVTHHPEIRSREACVECSKVAVDMARRHGTQLHLAHISTREELNLLRPDDKNITTEAVIGHLMFNDRDYARLGTLIKVNPSIKTAEDQAELRKALADGRISVVATDHAPHLLSDKLGGAAKAASGMPSIQYSLLSMLELLDQGVISMERLVELMCHNPAKIFNVSKRGFIRKGYKADLVMVRKVEPWTVRADNVMSKCGWTPFEGHTFSWRVERTFCNGKTVFADGHIVDTNAAEAVRFRE